MRRSVQFDLPLRARNDLPLQQVLLRGLGDGQVLLIGNNLRRHWQMAIEPRVNIRFTDPSTLVNAWGLVAFLRLSLVGFGQWPLLSQPSMMRVARHSFVRAWRPSCCADGEAGSPATPVEYYLKNPAAGQQSRHNFTVFTYCPYSW